ncbi:hypothetical protein [Nocardioides currus]|uniref:Polysaccharide chain length determinant N-terminal domain-containing protein n=1 Tax=Nocardioides currus TaxID=2133958 RepID=A0A2R7Z1A4_9ACTN|nr:hypothetical protein [Nocardioides currus]PUA82344.1 hypothetical protein C7S10_00900 [Nocardioides currus]
MDFVDVLRVLGRRWLIVLLGVLVTGAAGFYAITVVPTQYQARAQYVLLLPSGATGLTNPTNPYINLNSGLIFATSLIASDLGTKDVARTLVEDGFDSDYSIAQSTSGGPSLDVVVNGSDPDDVLATRNELLARFDEELDTLQDIPGIPDRQLIFSRTNAVDPVAEVVPGAKKKALVLIAAVGMVVTLVLAFSMDGLLRRRTARKQALKQPAASGAPEPPAETVDTSTPPAGTADTSSPPAKTPKPKKPKQKRPATGQATGQAKAGDKARPADDAKDSESAEADQGEDESGSAISIRRFGRSKSVSRAS